MFRIEVNHVKSGFFFASKRNEIFASFSNFPSEAKVRAHPTSVYKYMDFYHQNLALEVSGFSIGLVFVF